MKCFIVILVLYYYINCNCNSVYHLLTYYNTQYVSSAYVKEVHVHLCKEQLIVLDDQMQLPVVTVNYSNVELLCYNGNYICTYEQFVKEYQYMYPQFHYGIPKEIINVIGNNKANTNCIIIFDINENPFNNKNALWLCGNDIKEVFSFQNELSEVIRKHYYNYYINETTRSYTFICEYYNYNTSKFIRGSISLNKEAFVFRNSNNNEDILTVKYNEIKPYVDNIIDKDELLNNRNGNNMSNIPESKRCFKVVLVTKVTYYFCVYFSKNDFDYEMLLSVIHAHYLVNIYIRHINNLIHESVKDKTLSLLKEIENKKNVNSKINIEPLKYQIVNEIQILKHKLKWMLYLNEIDNNIYNKALSDIYTIVITKVCKGSILCNTILHKERNSTTSLPSTLNFNNVQYINTKPTPSNSFRLNKQNGGEIAQHFITEVLSAITGSIPITKTINNYTPTPNPFYAPYPHLTDIKHAYTILTSSKQSTLSIPSIHRKLSFLQYIGNSDSFYNTFINN